MPSREDTSWKRGEVGTIILKRSKRDRLPKLLEITNNRKKYVRTGKNWVIFDDDNECSETIVVRNFLISSLNI
jgi:hypothetical protein